MKIVKKIICLLLVLAMCMSMGGCKKKKKTQIVVIKRPASDVSDTVEDNTSGNDNF